MNHILSPAEHDRITQAIRRAESLTSGEIFVVVARAAGDHRLWGVVWATVLALLMPWPLWLSGLTSMPWPLAVQAGAFVIAALVLSQPAIAVRLTPRSVRAAAVRTAALEQFLAHGIHTTGDRTGVLIYVALAEHGVEIIADAGIHAAAAPETWNGAADAIVKAARDDRLADGLTAAVGLCGETLARHWPPVDGDRNHLPDRVVVL